MRIKNKYSWLKHLDFILIDLTALFLSFWCSYTLKFERWTFWNSGVWTRYVLVLLLLNLITAFFMNPYSGIFRRSYYQEVIRVLQLTVYNLVLASVIFYFFKLSDQYSREVTLYTFAFYFALSLILKYIWKKLLVTRQVVIYSTKRIPLFVIGNQKNIENTLRNITAGDFQLYEIKGVHTVDGKGTELSINIEGKNISVPVVNKEYLKYILDNNINEVLITTQPGAVDLDVYHTLTANGINISMVVEALFGFQSEAQYIQNFGVYKALSIGGFSFTPGQMFYLLSKRMFDIIIGLLGVAILIPIGLIIKVLYLLNGDTKSILYQQARIGKNGKQIRMWKFRTMIPNAEEVLNELLKNPEYKRQWDENQKFDNDPRITKVGRVLRRTSIDELPQLINVLIGNMSLVGPRPLVKGELEAHDGLKLYQRVKPGITGWWGCNGRSNIDYRERLELEYYYVKNCSLYLDILCIFRTILAVLKKDGAQ